VVDFVAPENMSWFVCLSQRILKKPSIANKCFYDRLVCSCSWLFSFPGLFFYWTFYLRKSFYCLLFVFRSIPFVIKSSGRHKESELCCFLPSEVPQDTDNECQSLHQFSVSGFPSTVHDYSILAESILPHQDLLLSYNFWVVGVICSSDYHPLFTYINGYLLFKLQLVYSVGTWEINQHSQNQKKSLKRD